MIYLAPLQALTDLAFRKAYISIFKDSFDFAVSPFISLTHGDFTLQPKKLRDVLPERNENSIPVIPQILGKEIPEFISLANALYQLGYNEINWNMGCPMPQVTGKKRGAGLLPYPDDIKRILDEVVPNIKPKLSIKMRLGFESAEDFFAIIPVLNTYSLANICIHPRTALQMYEGDLHLNILEKGLSKIEHPVIFNGNIFSVNDFNAIKNRFPSIQDFMLGRGVLRNPFLPEMIKGYHYGNKQERFRLFHQNLLQEVSQKLYTEQGKLNKMKEYWSYFSQSYHQPSEAFSKIAQTQSISEFQKVVEKIVQGMF